MAAPEEVVAAPLTIYLAVVGTAAPAIDDAPADFAPAWVVLGTEGDNNYDDAGVTVDHAETVKDFTPVGSTMPTKRFRESESLMIELGLVDISPATYAKVMNNASVTPVPPSSGVAGSKKFSLFRGTQVNSFAVLARGLSSVDNTLNLQYFFSKAFVSVNGKPVFKKGDPVMLPVQILAVKHSDADEISLEIQTAAAS